MCEVEVYGRPAENTAFGKVRLHIWLTVSCLYKAMCRLWFNLVVLLNFLCTLVLENSRGNFTKTANIIRRNLYTNLITFQSLFFSWNLFTGKSKLLEFPRKITRSCSKLRSAYIFLLSYLNFCSNRSSILSTVDPGLFPELLCLLSLLHSFSTEAFCYSKSLPYFCD